MSTTNRSTSRWSSSTKSNSSTSQSMSILSARKKPPQPLTNQQQTFAQRTAKTRHDVEQLFKLYYSTNIKFDTFQRQVVTGTRIPSAPSPPLTHDHLSNSLTNAFRSKHCVSREDEESPRDTNEHQIINDESIHLPTKRTLQVRIDHHPIIIPSISPSPDGIFKPVNSDLENHPQSNESTLLKSLSLVDDPPTDSFELNHFKKSKATLNRHPISSITSLPPIPSSTLSFINNRRDLMNLSHSSFPTMHSSQPHIVTGSAVIVRERAPTKSALNKQRMKSSSQQTNLKTSPVSIQYEQPELPVSMGARVVSIPSKCSRYVLLTFPSTPVHYKVPTYVERLLLPERFPALFQNIVHNRK